MAPRKAAEKPRTTLEPRKCVKKKTPTVKSIGAKLKTVPLADLLMSDEDKLDSQNLPKKDTKRKLPSKININGIKAVKDCKANTVGSNTPKNASPRNKRARQIHDVHGDEATGELQNPEDVFTRNKRSKTDKQHQNHMKMDDKAIEEAVNPKHIPMKVNNVKVTRIKKKKQSEINIMLVDEVTAESNNAEETPSKAKRMKATIKQKQENVKLIITKEDDIPKANFDELRSVAKDVPPKIKKGKAASTQNNNEIKVMLANEVIRSAFEKKPKIVKNLNRPVLTRRAGGVERLRRPARNKPLYKPDINVLNTNKELKSLLSSPERIQDVAKKKIPNLAHCRKKSTHVPLEEVPQQLASVTSPSPVTQVTPIKRRMLSQRRQTILVIDEPSQNTPTVTEGKEGTKESASVDNNISIFNSDAPTAPDSASKVDCEPNITCRRNSGTSTSTCFSWTKDISSSSTITCVTVKSNDFVRIDKKLPIVKLTNLDHQTKRQNYVDRIFDGDSCDIPFHEESKCHSECNSVSITDLNVPQTLDLSTSSLTSVDSNRVSEDNRASKGRKDERVIRLEQSLENLVYKIKNFDLEIMNWIGSNKENKDSKIENLHARIFQVLNNENEVIKNCKEIKRVLYGDQRATEPSKGYPKEIETTRSEQTVEHFVDNNSSTSDKLNSEDQNKYVLETNLGSNDRDTKDIPVFDEELNNRKSFEKIHDMLDNDDDDALSLFAESLTGLESSRKNSSFALSVSHYKTRSGLDDTLRTNGRAIVPITYFDDEDSASSQDVNNVNKQTADSSTASNIVSDKPLNSKLKIDDRISVQINNNFSDAREAQELGVRYNRMENTNGSAEDNSNRCLGSDTQQISNIHTSSPINAIENCRSDDFETYRAGARRCSLDDYCFDYSKDVSGIPVSTSGSCSDSTRLVRNNTNAEYVSETENSNLVPYKPNNLSAANQLAMASKRIKNLASSVFKSVCVYNLVTTCNKPNCGYPHYHVDVDIVRSKLQGMEDETFMKESKFLIKWQILKLTYGMCYIEECVRRNMTFWLLYLVKEFLFRTSKLHRGEENFNTAACEITLLQLNDADIQPGADILRSSIKNNFYMCDYLMMTISKTQNFSRFKNIFIKLTLFMFHDGRSFSVDVATQLVERLCILPYDDALARVLIKVITNTDPNIFSIPMMKMLESQLEKNNAQLYEELISLKQQAGMSSNKIASPPTQSPCVASSNAGYHTSTPITRADSPDTTNTDSVNKTTEPLITRTITINRTINMSNLTMSTGSESSETTIYEPRRPGPMWWSYPPRPMYWRPPQRPVFRRRGYAPRGYFGNFPKFYRMPPHNPY